MVLMKKLELEHVTSSLRCDVPYSTTEPWAHLSFQLLLAVIYVRISFESEPTSAGPDGLPRKWTCVLARLSVRGMLDVGYLTSTVLSALTRKQTHPSSQGHRVVAIHSPLFSSCTHQTVWDYGTPLPPRLYKNKHDDSCLSILFLRIILYVFYRVHACNIMEVFKVTCLMKRFMIHSCLFYFWGFYVIYRVHP